MIDMGDPKISVLMSVYNGEKYLTEAIDSILAQTYTDFEFLIIDDGSTDRTSEILFSYDDPRIRIVTNKENIGLTKSLNKGLVLARGEYIARMDADDISNEKRLEKQVFFLDNYQKYALVGSAIQTINEEGKKIQKHFFLKEPQYFDFLKNNQLVHGSVMIRKKILLEFSGYNEIFKKCQDYALWLQIIKKYKVFNLPEILYYLRQHNHSISLINNESILFHILAHRFFESNIDDKILKQIEVVGISQIMDDLSKKEQIFYHNSLANRYRFHGDYVSAKKEYRNIFKIYPYNLTNLVHIIQVSCGSKLINSTAYIFTIFCNIINRIKYL